MFQRIIIVFFVGLLLPLSAAEPLRICVTTPDLGALVRPMLDGVGSVTVFARSGDNPHLVDARPSFIASLRQADALVFVGVDLEIGWLPALIKGSRRTDLALGTARAIDVSTMAHLHDVPTGIIDRSHGDIHAGGNPHYLMSPVQALLIIPTLAQRLAALHTEHAERLLTNAKTLRRRLAQALYGLELNDAAEIDAIVQQHLQNAWEHIPCTQESWLGRLSGLKNRSCIGDHDQWIYLAQCYGIRMSGHLEPKPGIPPGARHIATLRHITDQETPVCCWCCPWFDTTLAQRLCDDIGVPLVILPHQPGALPGTDELLTWYGAQVDSVLSAQK